MIADPGRRRDSAAVLIVLVVMLAFGVYLVRLHRDRAGAGSIGPGETIHQEGFWVACTSSLGLFLCALLPSTRDRERLSTSPGFCVHCGVAMGFLLVLAYSAIGGLARPEQWAGRRYDHFLAETAFSVLTLGLPQTVGATWAYLLMLRRWRPRRTLVEALGMSLGAYWICWPYLSDLVSYLDRAARGH